MARCRHPYKEPPWRPKVPHVKPFDLTKYLGDPAKGIEPRWTEVERPVVLAGTAALILAISQPTKAQMRAEANDLAAQNRHRFHSEPMGRHSRTKRRDYSR